MVVQVFCSVRRVLTLGEVMSTARCPADQATVVVVVHAMVVSSGA